MKIKNIKSFSNWEFFIVDGEKEIRIPVSGYSSSIHELKEAVELQFGVMVEFNWKEKLAQEAASNNIPEDEVLVAIIEHQICLRNKDVECWESGIGDKVHSLLSKADAIIPTAVAKVLTKAATGTSSKTLGGCRTCGGTPAYNPSVKNNMGRAGALNNIGKKPGHRVPMG